MKYTSQTKEQIIIRYQKGETISALSLQTGIPKSTLYSWIKKSLNSQNTSTPLDYHHLQKHVAKLESMIEILQQIPCTLDSPLQEKLYELEKFYGKYSVHTICDSLKISRGTFYNHVLRNKKKNTSYQARRESLSMQIKEIHEQSNQIYGAKKIRAILLERGIITSDKMVTRLMNEMNLCSIRNDSKRIYTKQKLPRKKDHLKKTFSVTAPNQVWVSDVTYYQLKDVWYYICAIIDLYARKVIAYKISRHNSTQMLTSTFKQAYADRHPPAGLIFHSDRGAPYIANSFQKLLISLNVIQSFSPSGSPQNNAVMESFFSTLKKEELYRHIYHSEHEFKEHVHEYISMYNSERPHATNQYKSPNAFEAMYQASSKHKSKT